MSRVSKRNSLTRICALQNHHHGRSANSTSFTIPQILNLLKQIRRFSITYVCLLNANHWTPIVEIYILQAYIYKGTCLARPWTRTALSCIKSQDLNMMEFLTLRVWFEPDMIDHTWTWYDLQIHKNEVGYKVWEPRTGEVTDFWCLKKIDVYKMYCMLHQFQMCRGIAL